MCAELPRRVGEAHLSPALARKHPTEGARDPLQVLAHVPRALVGGESQNVEPRLHAPRAQLRCPFVALRRRPCQTRHLGAIIHNVLIKAKDGGGARVGPLREMRPVPRAADRAFQPVDVALLSLWSRHVRQEGLIVPTWLESRRAQYTAVLPPPRPPKVEKFGALKDGVAAGHVERAGQCFGCGGGDPTHERCPSVLPQEPREPAKPTQVLMNEEERGRKKEQKQHAKKTLMRLHRVRLPDVWRVRGSPGRHRVHTAPQPPRPAILPHCMHASKGSSARRSVT